MELVKYKQCTFCSTCQRHWRNSKSGKLDTQHKIFECVLSILSSFQFSEAFRTKVLLKVFLAPAQLVQVGPCRLVNTVHVTCNNQSQCLTFVKAFESRFRHNWVVKPVEGTTDHLEINLPPSAKTFLLWDTLGLATALCFQWQMTGVRSASYHSFQKTTAMETWSLSYKQICLRSFMLLTFFKALIGWKFRTANQNA